MDWYSPATIAAEIAALVCAAEIAERNGEGATAANYRAMADDWQRKVAGWTRTRNGPLSSKPYYLRLTTDGNADAGTTYTIGDGGPTIDQRRVVDASFLELVRLGVKPADDRDIRSTLPVVDRELGVTTPNGQFWHRYNYDGYGETPDGGPFPGDGNRGRLWPLLAGERGEYELAAGELSGDAAGARRAATARLDAIAATASEGWMLPEQVWDDSRPRAARASRPARARCRRRRWPGRTRSSSASPGRSTPGARSSARTSSPAATSSAVALSATAQVAWPRFSR